MNIDIYQSALKTDKYLGLPHGTDLGTWKAPAGFDPDLTQVRPLHSTVDLHPGVPRIALDPDDVIDQINRQGWAAIGVSMKITIGTAS